MNLATLDYIHRHAADDVRQLALRGSNDPEVQLSYALEQIAGRQKAQSKLPSWAAIDGIVYPPHLSMEQCSSELTARYKASIAGQGAQVVDLTAGFGVDMAFISQGFREAVHVERQQELCVVSSANYQLLGLQHIQVVCGDGVEYLHQMAHADLIFIDPARRDEHGSRTYGIADCTPNILEIMDEMLEKADGVLGNTETLTKNLSDLDIAMTMAKVNTTLQNVEQLTAKLNSGEGTIGLLMTDPGLYRNLTSTMSHTDSLIMDLKAHPMRYVHFSLFGRKDR